MYEPAGDGAGGVVFVASGSPGDRPVGDRPGSSAPGETDEPSRLLEAIDEEDADVEALRRAQEIAERLAVRHPRPDSMVRRGLGDLRTVMQRPLAR